MRVEAANGVENVKDVFRYDIPVKIRAELRVEELHDEVADDGIVEEFQKRRARAVRHVLDGGGLPLKAVLIADESAAVHERTKLASSGVVGDKGGRGGRDANSGTSGWPADRG
jgi:hypothetical protein